MLLEYSAVRTRPAKFQRRPNARRGALDSDSAKMCGPISRHRVHWAESDIRQRPCDFRGRKNRSSAAQDAIASAPRPRSPHESRICWSCAVRWSPTQARRAPDAISRFGALRVDRRAVVPANPKTKRPAAVRPKETSQQSLAESTKRGLAKRARAREPQKIATQNQTEFFRSHARSLSPAAARTAFQSLFRHLHNGKNFRNRAIGRQSFQISFGLEQNAMPKNRRRCGLHVVRDQKIAALHSSERAGHREKPDGSPGLAPREIAGKSRVRRTRFTR